VAAKLLSAAAWRHLGFESDPLQTRDAAFSPKSLMNRSATGASSDAGAGRAYSAGEWMGEVLLSSGGFLPSHHSVILLLGGSADVLLPVETDSSSGTDVSHGVGTSAHGVDTVSDTAPDVVRLDEPHTAGNEPGSMSRLHSREPGPGGQTGPATEFVAAEQHQGVLISGWFPCLYHEVYQDVELT
jgi:hypothetical protein